VKYFNFILLMIFSSYSSAHEEKTKISIFGGVIEIPSNCVLYAKPSLDEGNRLKYICESSKGTEYTGTHIYISKFSDAKFDTLKLEEGVSNFKVREVNNFRYYTADYEYIVAGNEIISAEFNVVCDNKFCININSTDKNIVRKLLVQFGIKYV